MICSRRSLSLPRSVREAHFLLEILERLVHGHDVHLALRNPEQVERVRLPVSSDVSVGQDFDRDLGCLEGRRPAHDARRRLRQQQTQSESQPAAAQETFPVAFEALAKLFGRNSNERSLCGPACTQ